MGSNIEMKACLRFRILIFLYMVSFACCRKKKSSADGGDDSQDKPCEEVYIGGYFVDDSAESYVGWDSLQAGDLMDNGVENTTAPEYKEWELPMLDSYVLSPYCTPISYQSQATKTVSEINTVTTINGYTVINHTSVTNTYDTGGDRRLLAGDDEGETYDTTVLPAIEYSSCDYNEDEQKKISADIRECQSTTKEWACTMFNVTGLMKRLRELIRVEVDDCWTEGGVDPRCIGAPTGAINCSMTPLLANQYATGIKVTINGDRCSECSLPEDQCNGYYDVHNCQLEWVDVSTEPPPIN